MAVGGVGAGNSRKAEMRRKAFLKHMQLGLTIREAMERVGWTSIRSYHRARKLWPEWATQIDAAAAANKRQGPDKLIGPPRVYGKRDEFLAALRRGLGVAEACAAVGWTDTSSYRKQRSLDPDFAEEVDRIVRPGWYPTDKLWTPADGFVGFRDQFLDHKTPWFHQLVVDAINEMPPGSVLLILFPPEHGKGNQLSEKVPTPQGWTTIGDLKVGDTIFAADGAPTRVNYLSPVRNIDCYRITLTDGTSLVVDGEHRFLVRCRDREWRDRASGRRGHKTEVLDVRTIATRLTHHGRPNFAIPVADALELPDVELPVDPYVLGCWLGDGATNGGVVSKPEPEMWANIELAGYRLGKLQADGMTRSVLGLRPQLRAAGVFGDKHIPPAYLRASVKQRTALLQGLMDTDGSCSRGQCEFSNMNKRLVDGAEELIRTLGFKVRLYGGRAMLNGKDYGPKYRLSFYPRSDRPVFRITRKLERQTPADTPNDRERWNVIASCEPVESVPTRCLQVEHPSHLFISGRGFTVSHNTSFWEDYDIFRLCVDPSTRITVGSEKLAQATKIVRYVRTMLDHEAGGMAPLRDQFGPFAPPKGAERTASAAQAWSAAAFDVAKKPRGLQGQRDFSMQALGMRSSIVGTRCDILQVDDPQSRESLRKKENTEQLVDNFRQDWLSRPGEDGITVILMNRVGEGDFPQFLMEKTELVTRVLKVKAWDPERGGWAWPERYSQADYLAKRKKVGEDAWQRNFMQIGLADRDATFTDKILAKAKNHLRSIMHAPPRPPGGGQAQIIITVDPGKAKTSFHVAALEPDRFVSLDLRLLENAMAYGVFGDVVHELCVQFHRPGLALVTTVIVETKAFQSLLMTDQSMLAAQKQFNFELRPFDTGTLKNDEDFGVPQVARMMERGEIDFPDMDAQSQERYAPLYAQCRRWRPMKRGNRLEQDHVMTLWFAVDYWNLNVRGRHGDGDGDSSAFDFGR